VKKDGNGGRGKRPRDKKLNEKFGKMGRGGLNKILPDRK
jgi:hypothetical protein